MTRSLLLLIIITFCRDTRVCGALCELFIFLYVVTAYAIYHRVLNKTFVNISVESVPQDKYDRFDRCARQTSLI